MDIYIWIYRYIDIYISIYPYILITVLPPSSPYPPSYFHLCFVIKIATCQSKIKRQLIG